MTCFSETEALEQAHSIVHMHGRGEAVVHFTTTIEDLHPESILEVTPKLLGVTIPDWDLQTMEGIAHATSSIQVPMLIRKLYAAGFQVTKLERIGAAQSRNRSSIVNVEEVEPTIFDMRIALGEDVGNRDIPMPAYGGIVGQAVAILQGTRFADLMQNDRREFLGFTHRRLEPRNRQTGELVVVPELGHLHDARHPYLAYAEDVLRISRWPDTPPTEQEIQTQIRATQEALDNLRTGNPDDVTIIREMRARNRSGIIDHAAGYAIETARFEHGTIRRQPGGNHGHVHRDETLRNPDPADLDAAIRRERDLRLTEGTLILGLPEALRNRTRILQPETENPTPPIRRIGEAIKRRLRNLRNPRDET